jgi:hypothetical protein
MVCDADENLYGLTAQMSQNRSSHTNVLERRFIPFSIEVLCETIEWRTRFEDIMFGRQAEIPDFA